MIDAHHGWDAGQSIPGKISSHLVSAPLSNPAFTFPQANYTQQMPLCVSMHGISLYGHIAFRRQESRPARVVILTSIRDVGCEERIGTPLSSSLGGMYRMGAVEMLLKESTSGHLKGVVEIVKIISDDYAQEVEPRGYATVPRDGERWIAPTSLVNGDGHTLNELTVNIPSSFRKLPLEDRTGRETAKLRFESAIHAVMVETRADILLSDHFLARLDYLIRPEIFGLKGRVLNIHPGITHRDRDFKCIGKAPDDLALLHAQGRRVSGDGNIVACAPHHSAGATLHFVSARIDAGPVICDAERSTINPDDPLELVQYKIYRDSKLPVLAAGLAHYVRNILPSLS